MLVFFLLSMIAVLAMAQPDFCCTVQFDTCLGGYCDESIDNCIGGPCGTDSFWVPLEEDSSNCRERRSGCESSDQCCGPLECRFDSGQNYMSCEVPEDMVNGRVGVISGTPTVPTTDETILDGPICFRFPPIDLIGNKASYDTFYDGTYTFPFVPRCVDGSAAPNDFQVTAEDHGTVSMCSENQEIDICVSELELVADCSMGAIGPMMQSPMCRYTIDFRWCDRDPNQTGCKCRGAQPYSKYGLTMEGTGVGPGPIGLTAGGNAVGTNDVDFTFMTGQFQTLFSPVAGAAPTIENLRLFDFQLFFCGNFPGGMPGMTNR